MRVALGQLNPVVGDVEGNTKKVLRAIEEVDGAADLIVFPEMCLTGYPPRDLLETQGLRRGVVDALADIQKATERYPGTGVVVGAPTETGASTGAGLHNSALLFSDGELMARRAKVLLPTYDVFDETRYFDSGGVNEPIDFKGERLALTVCEDALGGEAGLSARSYGRDPVEELLKAKATVLINLSASPFHLNKERLRYHRLSDIARRGGLPVVYVNQVGGNDELVFDGGGFALDASGRPLLVQPSFRRDVSLADLAGEPAMETYREPVAMESLRGALTLGLRDYLHKCGFQKAVVGLSGGVDSAVTCCLAVEALGKENVCGVAMPSPYSAPLSLRLAREQAERLGIRFETIRIEGPYEALKDALRVPLSLEGEIDVTLENLQARIRGALLMAFSNRQGYMVLATGNKSEMSVGYCTLYGDMCGGMAVLSDVPKTTVYELAHHLNASGEVIPREVLERPPSAELKPDQKDQDTLPPYTVLDEVLRLHIEEGLGAGAIEERGFHQAQVRWILKAVHRNEYKRRQAAAGLKVTTKAFGIGRRMPVAASVEEAILDGSPS